MSAATKAPLGGLHPPERGASHERPALSLSQHVWSILVAHGPRLRKAIQQFLNWAERAGYQDLEDIEPITVAAYIETLQRRAAAPTVKQHMAAIRMLFSWLTEKGVLAMNPAREVKTERFSRTEGKTPAFVEGEVQKLLGAIEASSHTGLRDRALLGVLAYTFARIGAVVNLKVEDYYPSGKCGKLRRAFIRIAT
jgi:site-specific recombinase XerD